MKKLAIMLLLCTSARNIVAADSAILKDRLSEEGRTELLTILNCIELLGKIPTTRITELPNNFGCKKGLEDYDALYAQQGQLSEQEFEQKKQELKRNMFGILDGYSHQEEMNIRTALRHERILTKRLSSTTNPTRRKRLEKSIARTKKRQEQAALNKRKLLTKAVESSLNTPRNVASAIPKPPASRLMRHRRSAKKLDSKTLDQ